METTFSHKQCHRLQKCVEGMFCTKFQPHVIFRGDIMVPCTRQLTKVMLDFGTDCKDFSTGVSFPALTVHSFPSVEGRSVSFVRDVSQMKHW